MLCDTVFSLLFFSALFEVNSAFLQHRKWHITNLTYKTENLTNAKWIKLPVDHYNLSDTRTWKMRYLENLKYYKPSGPILIEMGGEDDLVDMPGPIEMLAKETNGAIYKNEHRYYGKSQPLDNSAAENLKYLSSRQSLADVATLLKNLKMTPEYKNSKVVVFGCSYAGNLASWMRLIYPDLVDAALAMSAPVLAKINFYEYMEKVSDALNKYGGSDCAGKVRKMFERFEKLLKTDKGIEQLKKELNICSNTDLRKPNNKYTLFEILADAFAGMVQYGNPSRIKVFCNTLNYYEPTTMKKYFIKDDNSGCCDLDFNKVIQEDKKQSNVYSWFYQCCTEFGYWQTLSSDNQIFTKNLPIDYYYEMCTALFGPEFDEKRVKDGVDATNEMYGGLKLNTSKVFFTNGDMDPWSALSILTDISPAMRTLVYPDESHCAHWANAAEPIDQIKKWIGFS